MLTLKHKGKQVILQMQDVTAELKVCQGTVDLHTANGKKCRTALLLRTLTLPSLALSPPGCSGRGLYNHLTSSKETTIPKGRSEKLFIAGAYALSRQEARKRQIEDEFIAVSEFIPQ